MSDDLREAKVKQTEQQEDAAKHRSTQIHSPAPVRNLAEEFRQSNVSLQTLLTVARETAEESHRISMAVQALRLGSEGTEGIRQIRQAAQATLIIMSLSGLLSFWMLRSAVKELRAMRFTQQTQLEVMQRMMGASAASDDDEDYYSPRPSAAAKPDASKGSASKSPAADKGGPVPPKPPAYVPEE
ncbi:MAG TPA: hypothetical protein PL033_14765 [Candidatus Brocadiia bacterium]|nr:hypothetical protein [Candidatus Brocadiia bacterium]